MKKAMSGVLTSAVVLWILIAAVRSFFVLPPLLAQSLAQSTPADHQAAQVAAQIEKWIPLRATTTVLYLNGTDGGDNYYRVRYLLYPVRFIDYWSWQHPNAGGDVWNTPRFSTEKSLRHILLTEHVDDVVAVHNPKMLSLIGMSGRWQYIFKVERALLVAGAPLRKSLVQVVKWR